MKISIFGAGYVGAVSSACFAALGHEVVAVDLLADKVAMIAAGQSPIVEAGMDELMRDGVASGRIKATSDTARAVADSDVSFVSVGMPSAADGSASMAAVRGVLSDIGKALKAKHGHHAILMRSTVPPGTAEDLAIPLLAESSGRKPGTGFSYYSNPEFLREGTAVRDFEKPPFTLIGAMPGDDAPLPRALYAGRRCAGARNGVAAGGGRCAKDLANVYHAVQAGLRQ